MENAATLFEPNTKTNLLDLVDLLQKIPDDVPNGRLNEFSMFNRYMGKQNGNDSEIRTFFGFHPLRKVSRTDTIKAYGKGKASKNGIR